MKPFSKSKSLIRSALATGLAASTAGAATVQISLSGNRISTVGGNHLNADVTGDLFDDVTFSFPSFGPSRVQVVINGWSNVYAGISSLYNARARFTVGGVGTSNAFGPSPVNIKYLNPISFTDIRINGNAATQAWLQVHALNLDANNHNVALTRLIFDDASTTRPSFGSFPDTQTEWSPVPEPSSFALLTLGGAGVLLRRHRKAA